MKLPALIILCCLALCGARGADSLVNVPPGKSRIVVMNPTKVPEAEAVVAAAEARNPDIFRSFKQLELVSFHDFAERPMERNNGAAENVPGEHAKVAWVSSAGGMIIWGPYDKLDAGSYVVVYRLQFYDKTAAGDVAFLDVAEGGGTKSALHPKAAEVPPGAWQELALPLKVPELHKYEFRLWGSGKKMAMDRVYVFKVTDSLPLAQTPPAASGSTPGDPAPRDLVKTYRNSLVFVSGAEGAGSGFIANYGGANFLFTNAHVAAGIKSAGFKTLDGKAVQVGTPSIAVGHDIFRMQLAPGGTPFEIMQGVDEKVMIDDEVMVLGNAEGAGVINNIKGKIIGVGPQLVEVDAPFQPGNSGSPIIHLKTGKVIGVATYLTIKKYDAATKEVLKAPVIRRFGYRLDSVKTWQSVNWQGFFAQAAQMEAIERLTADLGNFLVDLSKNGGRVTDGAHNNPAIKTRIDQWLADKKRRMSPKDEASVDQNFISFLKVACRSDISASKPRLTYDYFQRALAGEEQARGEIADIFDKLVKELQKGR